jgi:hypothetical protein
MTSETDPKTVLLRGDPVAAEGVAAGAITPGMMVSIVGTTASAVVTAATAGYIAPSVAREMELTGGGIDDAYAADDQVLCYTPRRGDQYYAILGLSQTIAAGALLACGAGGLLVAVGSAAPVARALEAVTTGGGATARIKVEIV